MIKEKQDLCPFFRCHGRHESMLHGPQLPNKNIIIRIYLVEKNLIDIDCYGWQLYHINEIYL